MTRKRRFTATIVAAVGIFVSGCCALGQPEENESKFCASPVEGGQYCVSTSDGPEAAWNKADAEGNEPIQMWAVWPENLELTELVVHRNLLIVWLDNQRTVKDFVCVTKGSAESCQATLSGHMREDLQTVANVQLILDAAKVDGAPFGADYQVLADDFMRVDPVMIDKVQDKLNAGDIKGAALAHDALLSSLEGT